MVGSGLLSFLDLKLSNCFSLKLEKHNIPPLFLNGTRISPVGFVFDSALTWKPRTDIIGSKTKNSLIVCLNSIICTRLSF